MNICIIHGLKEKLYIGSDTYLLWDRISFGHLCGPMFQWTWRLAFPSVEWELGSTNFLGSYAASIWVVFLFGDLSFAIIVLLWVYCLFLFFSTLVLSWLRPVFTEFVLFISLSDVSSVRIVICMSKHQRLLLYLRSQWLIIKRAIGLN